MTRRHSNGPGSVLPMRGRASPQSRQRELIGAHDRAVREVSDGIGNLDFIACLDRFRHRESRLLFTERAVLNRFRSAIPRGITEGDALYTTALGVRQYAQLAFFPGAPSDLVIDGQLALNTWIDPLILPQAGDPTPFVDLLRLVLDDDDAAINFLLDTMASLIQQPATKLAYMVLLIGPQGIGKSLVCEMLAELVGRRNAAFPTIEAIKSSFTGWLSSAQLIVIHELEQLGREVASRIKHWITAETLLINAKNVPEYPIRNFANIIACANHDDAAHLDHDDRRVFSWISQATKREPEFYARLCQWFFDGDGKGIVLNFLLQRDLSRFNPKAAPPRTTGRARLISNSLSEAERFLQEALESQSPPFVTDLCTAREVLQYLRVHLIRATDAEVRRFFRQHAISLGQHRIRGERPCLWAVRNFHDWQSASTEAIAASYRSPFDQHDTAPDSPSV